MTDIEQICARLIELWDADCDINVEINELRAALAEPKPDGPTGIEIASILKAYAVIEPQMGASRILHEKHFSNAAHAIRARWGK